jgi:hypothetical protein
MSAARLEPFPPDWTVRRARDTYLAENGFTVEAYDLPKTDASFLGVRFSVPNTPKHRWGIMLHDLHHVATGFGTDIRGEGEISAWEMPGVRALGPYVGGIVGSGAIMGFLFAPRRALAAWRARRTTLFDLAGPSGIPYESLLDMTIGELRALLGVPREGLAREPRKLHQYAPRAVAQT